MTRGLNRRRGDEARVKAAAKVVVAMRADGGPVNPREVGKAASVHSVDCSCAMCGNPRTHFKQKSIAERRVEQSRTEDDML